MTKAIFAFAGPHVAIYSEETPASRLTVQSFINDLRAAGAPDSNFTLIPQEVWLANPSAPHSAGVDQAIAVGPKALQHVLTHVPARQIIAGLLTRSALDEILATSPSHPGREIYSVVLDQPLTRYLDLIRFALPQRTRLGVLLSANTAGLQKPLEKLAAEKGLSINAIRFADEASFIPLLDRLLSHSDVLVAMPDPAIHKRSTIQPLLLSTYRVGVPVIAYSEAYTQAGALVSLSSTPAQIARHLAEISAESAQGRALSRTQAPRYYSVSVNTSVARSLGLNIPTNEKLLDALQAREKQ